MAKRDEPRIDTNTDGAPWLRRRQGMKPQGSAGAPPAQVFPQPGSFPPPGSTGNGTRTLLRPGPCRARRLGGRVPHRRETERHRTGVHAGGTPALPGGPPPIPLAPQGGARRLAGPRPYRCGRAVTLGGPSGAFVSLRGSLFFRLLQTSSAPAPGDGADHSRVKQRVFIACREQGHVPLAG